MHDRSRTTHSTLHHRNSSGYRTHVPGDGSGGISGMLAAEDPAGREGQQSQQPHRGMVAVPGPATADKYSSHEEGLDRDQARSNGYMDAAQALLGGMATSAANKGYNDNNSINGNDKNHGSWNSGAGDAEQIRGDAIHHRQGLPTVNHKGHGDDRSFLRGLRFFVKSTRGLVNSYWSTVARQQRERSRRMSNSKSKALDGDDGIEEAEGLLGRGAQRAGAAGATNGTLHRSWSSIAVGSSQGGSTMQEVELSDIEAGSGSGGVRGMGFDARELAGGGEAVALLPATEAGDGTGYGGDCALNSLRRGVRSRATTGDLILLARDEEQGAGEDSAQEDCKQPNYHGARTRWGVGPRTNTMLPQQVRSSVEQWKKDQWTDRSFKVLGVEIGNLPASHQFFVCAGGVFAFLLVYGYMQEYLAIGIFNRKLGLFLTLLQFLGYAVCAALRRGVHSEQDRKIPMLTYWGLGFLQACMQGLTNVSMMYLNYPAKVLFKSSRMVPIMCFGVVWQNRKYSRRDYCVVFLIVTGLATFMNAENRASEESETPFSLLGVACISLALVVDAAIINIQEEVMNTYDSCQDELIMFSYLCGAMYVAVTCVMTGDFQEGVVFLHNQGTRAMLAVVLFVGAGFLGASCAAALTKRFGALHSAITTTARKAVTLMLSFIVFPNKPFSIQHGIGAAIFISGLVTKASSKKGASNGPNSQSVSNSPGTTPFIQTRDRKHLPVGTEGSDQFDTSSSAAPLLSGGSGGGSCGGGGHGANGSGGDVDRTHSPSPVGPEGSATLTGNSGGHPVRHRGIPKNGGATSVGGESGISSGVSSGRGGRWVRRNQTSEGIPERRPLSLSPLRRANSPPVTGLSMRVQA